jgi:hypothetical protein
VSIRNPTGVAASEKIPGGHVCDGKSTSRTARSRPNSGRIKGSPRIKDGDSGTFVAVRAERRELNPIVLRSSSERASAALLLEKAGGNARGKKPD